MGAYRHRATWRSITFNEQLLDDGTKALDDPANIVDAKLNDAYYLDELDINRVSVQDYRELRQFLEGAEPNEAFEGVRAFTGQGIINAATYGQLEDKAWALNEAFSVAASRLAAASATPKGVLPFDFKRDTGSALASVALRAWCRPGPGRPIWIGRRQGGLARPFTFQLVSFDPFVYDVTRTDTALGNLSGGANNITNPGNIYTYPTIVIAFSGAGNAALVLTNTTTGKSITMNLSAMANGQTLTIDTQRSTVVRDNGSDQYSKVTAGFLSDLYLLAGANNITWSSATGITSVTFQRRGAYA
jgi:hypothetical protein